MTKSVRTQIYRKHTNIKHKIFKELVPSVLTLLKKKHIRLGHAGIVDHPVNSSTTDFLKSTTITKEWTEAIKTFKIVQKCITANTTAICQE